ncbi:MAG: 4-alpha-glucanotransferase, partial [Deltaproteobacteria bacterium]|nr:4-alpha-glucanotransferase [Deltaproteobacteria bacterium]
AFGDDFPHGAYLPHNMGTNAVVYTGTHDNNTVIGWFRREAGRKEKARLSAYLGKRVRSRDLHWDFIRLAMMSPANTAVIPLQDILGLGEQARMNNPAGGGGNWRWRLAPDGIPNYARRKLEAMTATYGRK